MRRENRTLTIDFENEDNYYKLIPNGKAFIEFVVAFIMSIGFQLYHKPGCSRGFSLTRHSHYFRARLNGVPIWRIQCKECGAVFTVLPHFVLRYRKMSPDIASKALLSSHGGQSLEISSIILNISPMAIYRLVCSLGKACLVKLLTRCGLSLPEYFEVDEKHSACLTDKVYLPTVVRGHLIWHMGYTKDKSALEFEKSYSQFRQAGLSYDPTWKVRGILTDSFESTIGAMKKLFPDARIGNCLLHAAKKVGQKLKNIPAEVREKLSKKFYQLYEKANKKKGLKVFSFCQKLRRFKEAVLKAAGPENSKRISDWIKRKKNRVV